MAWKLTVAPLKPFPSVAGDNYPGALPGSTFVPSAIQTVEVDFTIKFEYTDEVDTAPVSLITIPPNLGVTGLVATIAGADTVRIQGTPINVFTDEIFRFVFPDHSEKNLPFDNTEPYDSIVKWAPPSSREKLVTYKFIVKYDDNPAATTPIVGASEEVIISQYFYWRYEPSLAAFKALVAKGKNY